MSAEVGLRRMELEDREAVLALRGRCFDAQDLDRERARFDWQYRANPAAPAAAAAGLPRGWLAERDGALLGAIGMVPCRVCIDGREAVTVTATDYMVDPEARALGLGLQLARRFLDPGSGPFPFATAPVASSLALWKLCGAEVVAGQDEPMLWVAAPTVTEGSVPPLAGAPTAGRAASEAAAQDVGQREVRAVTSFGPDHDGLFERLRATRRLWTCRDAAALHWRYLEGPCSEVDIGEARDAAGTLQGCVVVQTEPALGRATVAELCAAPDDESTLRALLHFALRRRRERGLGELYALHREAPAQAALAAAGFHRVAEHPLGFFGRPPARGPSLADWFLTAGDGDLLYPA